MESFSVRTHPLGREAVRLSGPDVPRVGGVNSRPRTPGFRRVVNSETAGKAGILVRSDLTPEIPLERGIVADTRAITPATIFEHSAALPNVLCPDGPAVRIEAAEIFVGLVAFDSVFRHASQHHAIRDFVSAVGVVRINIDIRVPGSG